jgi:dipeptidyl aminopeptidase/acylaminoacyl peptidase
LAEFAPAQPVPAKATTAKRPLTHNDYDIWRTIQSPVISPNGRFVAYTLALPDSDSELVVKDIDADKEFRHTRGKSAGAAAAKGAKGEPAAESAVASGKITFTADNRRLLFTIAPPKADPTKKAEKDKDAPRASLGIMDLADGKVTIIPDVRTFQLPEVSGAGVVYHKLPPVPAVSEKKADTQGGVDAFEEDFLQIKGKGKKGAGGAKQGPTPAAAKPSELVVHSFYDGRDATIPDVTDFMLSRDGSVLIGVISAKEPSDTGVFAFVTAGPPGELLKLPLATGKAKYSRFIWDETQRRLAFFADPSTNPREPGPISLYLWDREDEANRTRSNAPLAVEVLTSKTTTGLKDGCVLTERGSLTFSGDGSKIFIGVAPPLPPAEKEQPEAGTGKKDDKAIVELWHWKDDFIQPMQKVRAQQEKSRTYLAVYHIKNKKLVQLTDKTMPVASLSTDGAMAIGSDDTQYRPLVAYDGNYSDVFLINANDGSRKPLLKKHHWGVTFSPTGRFAIFYDGKDWNIINVSSGTVTNVTKDIPGAKLSNEDHDTPSASPAYGVAGWSNDENVVLINDKYDIWEVSTTGGGFRNMTYQVGRDAKAQFRYVKLDPKEKGIDVSKPMFLHFENLLTRATGFATLDPRGKGPVVLTAQPALLGAPTKAKQANRLLFTAQTFDKFPDLFVAGMDFKNSYRISDANPQRNQFVWGTSELIQYKNSDGVPLSGVLIKPDNFDATKKYPMLVYIYEKLSQNVHHFVFPKEGTSINPTFYASNGYLVLMPDIVYTIGYPGQSALKCVLPAIQSVVDKGFVNEDAIGIQGHSWGGYQIAYMITQTNRFKAAAAGAPVSNMTSAYDGIRWGTGLPRQFQYEKTQSRIGGSLWEFPMRFVENSPVFMADRVKTPLMILHNDHDDAVPWYQGIEYYLALRRLGKEVYLFNYPDELHGLRKKANQRDYTIRMQQFFDYHLKKAGPEPEWMTKGIPYTPRTPAKVVPAAGDID